MKRCKLNEKDLRALRIFRVAALAGGFSAAESKLHMSTATISRHVKEIEERLNVILCTRGPQGFALTNAGKVVLQCTSETLDALDRIQPAVEATKGVISGDLNIGISDNTISNFDFQVTKLLKAFYHRAPEVNVAIYVMPRAELKQALFNHQLDIVVSDRHMQTPSLAYTPLFSEEKKIYYSPHPINEGRDVWTLPLVTCVNHRVMEEVFRDNDFVKGPKANSIESVVMLISTGRFLGVLPSHYAEALSFRYDLRAIPQSPRYPTEFGAIINPSRPLPLSAEVLLSLIQQVHSTPVA